MADLLADLLADLGRKPWRHASPEVGQPPLQVQLLHFHLRQPHERKAHCEDVDLGRGGHRDPSWPLASTAQASVREPGR